MELIEQLSCRVTPPSKKKRKEPGYRTIDDKNHPGLESAIYKCMQTGEEQRVDGGFMHYVVKLVDANEKFTEDDCKEKGLYYIGGNGSGIRLIHVTEYSLLFTFGVRHPI